jgi:hypothetical protein
MAELFSTQEKPPRCFMCNFIIWNFILQREFAIPKDLRCILAVESVYKQPNKKVNVQSVNLYNRAFLSVDYVNHVNRGRQTEK